MKKFISIKKQVMMYIKHREIMGYVDANTKNSLLDFADYSHKKGQDKFITIEIALEWVVTSKRNKRSAFAIRLGMLHTFAKYCKAIEPKTEIPPRGLHGSTLHRPTPHIYTKNEIYSLMSATKLIDQKKEINIITLKYIIGLIVSTGIRISEAIKLVDKDVDLENGILQINESKAHKSRYLPLHTTTTQALKKYVMLRDNEIKNRSNLSFFINDKGNSISIGKIEVDYKLLRETAGLKNNPRLYDFRHTFACNRLLKWYEEEKNIDAMIIYLATYLGHSSVLNTYWYLTATPELFSIVSKRFEKFSHYNNRR